MKIFKTMNRNLRKLGKNSTHSVNNGKQVAINTNSLSNNDEIKLQQLLLNLPVAAFRMHLTSDSDNLHWSSHSPQQRRLHKFNAEMFVNRPPKIFPKSTRDNFMYEGSFYEAVGKIFVLAEFFAIMPVKGLTMSHPRYLSFSWSNYRTLYTLIFISIMIFDTTLAMHQIFNDVLTFNKIEPMIFRISIIIFLICSISLARKWPNLSVSWHEIEQKLPPFKSQMEKSRMAYKIRMVTFVSMMLSLVEHVLSCISIIHYSNFCPITDDPIENFFRLANEQIFIIFPYSYWWGWYGKIINFISTFIWNYMDVFVMIISIGLASKFEQLNANMMLYKNKQTSPAFWAENRILYRNLCRLCEEIDTAISMITMISFSNNLYFICVQLLRSINEMPSIAHAAYFYFSLIFLLGRTLAVSLYSSTVHDESRKPLGILRCVPKDSWCSEVKRFTEEISSDLVALSGMNFFHLTRKLVLSVAGTIVTYELVLIQFHEDTNLWDCEKDRHEQLEIMHKYQPGENSSLT